MSSPSGTCPELTSTGPRDEWLVEQLLRQVETLVEQLEGLRGLTPEEQIEWADLKALSQELGLRSFSARRALPWVLRLEQLLFGHWEPVEDGTVRCIYPVVRPQD